VSSAGEEQEGESAESGFEDSDRESAPRVSPITSIGVGAQPRSTKKKKTGVRVMVLKVYDLVQSREAVYTIVVRDFEMQLVCHTAHLLNPYPYHLYIYI
jgi:hypothetical protein